MTFWPRGWVLSQGRVLLEHGGLFEQGGRALLERGTCLTFWARGWVPFERRVLLELGGLFEEI